MRIRYNAPVILTFTFISLFVTLLGTVTDLEFTKLLFTAYPQFILPNPLYYAGFVTHIFGHANIEHFAGNFLLILLIGPLLEERHGSKALFRMILATAIITGILNALLFTTALVGASGVAFMLMLLGSFSNFRHGELPLTFILVAMLFLGKEFLGVFADDNVSQFAHILGGFIGAAFGYFVSGRRVDSQTQAEPVR